MNRRNADSCAGLELDSTVKLAWSKREVAPSRVVGLRIQQTHVSWRHVRNERSRSIRWLAELTRCRPTRNRFWITP